MADQLSCELLNPRLQIGRCQEVVAFLDLLDAVVPAGQVIHLVLDNLNVHRGPVIDDWVAAHPGRVQFHFLPYHASWLSQIEVRRTQSWSSARS